MVYREASIQEKTLERIFEYGGAGTVLETTTEFSIRGIRIDNLSNRWIYVHAVRRFVPPLTTGWQAFVSPSTQRVICEYVSAPDGAAPIPGIGGTSALVKMHEAPIDDSEGVAYGLGSVVVPIASYDVAFIYDAPNTDAVAATEKAHVMLAAPGAGYQYRLFGWSASQGQVTIPTVDCHFRLRSVPGSTIDHTIVSRASSSGFTPFGSHGVLAGENASIEIVSKSSGASTKVYLVIHYTTEVVG